MKKIFFTISLLICTLSILNAQKISDNALGIRIGNNEGLGGELSFQHKLSNDNRLEADLGWRSDTNYGAIKLVGLYQWIWPLENNFNLYAGVGAGFVSWNYDEKKYNFKNSGTFAFASGDIGIEYNFDFPLQVSLDLRPEFYFNAKDYRANNFGSDFGLGIRYKF
jgi:hypothetical protein